MLCVLNGAETDIPDDLLSVIQTRGMVSVADNTVSESDVNRVDEAAQDIHWAKDVIQVYRKRLYFELADGEQVEWPVGRQSCFLDAVWEIATVNITKLKKG